jgi:hypothetical protein
MAENRTYFSVGRASPVMKVIQEAIETERAHKKAVWAFADEFGAPRIHRTTNWSIQLRGLLFDGEPPKGWRVNVRKKCATPDERTKAGREIAKRMRALPVGVSAATFSSMLDEVLPLSSHTHWGDDTVSWSTFEQYGSKFVLSVPTACGISPPGCRELKMSEYWKIREGAEVLAAS